MFPNLLGVKPSRRLTNGDMGKIIGVSRYAFSRKMRRGSFLPDECRAICKYFDLPFEYLFALPEEGGITERPGK